MNDSIKIKLTTTLGGGHEDTVSFDIRDIIRNDNTGSNTAPSISSNSRSMVTGIFTKAKITIEDDCNGYVIMDGHRLNDDYAGHPIIIYSHMIDFVEIYDGNGNVLTFRQQLGESIPFVEMIPMSIEDYKKEACKVDTSLRSTDNGKGRTDSIEVYFHDAAFGDRNVKIDVSGYGSSYDIAFHKMLENLNATIKNLQYLYDKFVKEYM